jgi:glycosyltransferase involved in cell wall biosynthesis
LRKRDRTVVVANVFPDGAGAVSVSQDLASRLSALGKSVSLCSTQRNALRRLADIFLTIFRSRATASTALVEVYSGRAFLWAAWSVLWLRAFRIPIVLALHGGELPALAQKHPRALRALLSSARRVVAPSEFLAGALRRFRSDIVIIPNAIDVRAYQRDRLDAGGTMIWLRAFHQVYRPDIAVRVVAQLRERFPDVHLVMVGPDKDGSFSRVRDLATHLGVADRVDLRHAIPKAAVPSLLQEGTIFLNTTSVDNFPVSVVEAMAAGLCVVSSSVGGVPYLIRDGVNGFLVDGSADAFVTLLARILEAPAVIADVADAGTRTAENFDWSRVLPQWLKVLYADADDGSA